MSDQMQQARIALEIGAQIGLIINDTVEIIDRLFIVTTSKYRHAIL